MGRAFERAVSWLNDIILCMLCKAKPERSDLSEGGRPSADRAAARLAAVRNDLVKRQEQRKLCADLL